MKGFANQDCDLTGVYWINAFGTVVMLAQRVRWRIAARWVAVDNCRRRELSYAERECWWYRQEVDNESPGGAVGGERRGSVGRGQ
jgi:hypothetical protein